MNILITIDQLGNAISKGSLDSTISARIGFNHYVIDKGPSGYWNFSRSIVDFTSQAVDGKYHCCEAHVSDRQEEFRRGKLIPK